MLSKVIEVFRVFPIKVGGIKDLLKALIIQPFKSISNLILMNNLIEVIWTPNPVKANEDTFKDRCVKYLCYFKGWDFSFKITWELWMFVILYHFTF